MSARPNNQYLCGGCMKMRNRQRFSDTAIQKYEQAVSVARFKNKPLSSVRNPVCSGCRPAQAHEYECSKCGIMKSIEEFSGRQRRCGDDKECKDCVQEREDREPVFADEVLEYEIMENLGHEALLHDRQSSNISVAAASQRSQRSRRIAPSTTSDFYDAASWAGSVPIPEDPVNNEYHNRGGQQTIDAMSETSNTTTSTFRQTYAPAREHWSSVASSVDGGESGNAGFVKQNAVKPAPGSRARQTLQRQRQREEETCEEQIYAGDSSADDDDSDDDPPY